MNNYNDDEKNRLIADLQNYFEEEAEDEDAEYQLPSSSRNNDFDFRNFNFNDDSDSNSSSKFKKIAQNTSKFLGKTVKVIAKIWLALPLPIKIILVILIIGLTVLLIQKVIDTEASESVEETVKSTVSDMELTIKNSTVDSNTKDALQNSLQHFENQNSFLYFKLTDIEKLYETWRNQNSEDTNDFRSKNYESLNTIFGKTVLNSTHLNTARIVNPNDRLELYKHLFLTEKYNFNKIKWKWYGHGHNGEDVLLKDSTEYGLRYPDDNGKTELNTFIELTSPYLQTWHIPLGIHSSFLSNNDSKTAAANITYSVIKDAASEIIAHRYDLQKCVLHTYFIDYIETKWHSQFQMHIDVTKTYKPISSTAPQFFTKEITGAEAPKGLIIDYYKKGDQDYYTTNTFNMSPGMQDQQVNYYYGKSKGEVTKDIIIADIEKYYKETVFTKYAENYNEFLELTDTVNSTLLGKSVGNYLIYNITVREGRNANRDVFLVDINLIDSNVKEITEPKKNANGQILYTCEYKYEYRNIRLQSPIKEGKPAYINTRLIDSTKGNTSDNIDPMRETQVGDPEITVTPRYHIIDAKTFDVKIANTYNYIKYNQDDVDKRKNPYNEDMVKPPEEYNVTINGENKITDENLFKYVNNNMSLSQIDSNTKLKCTNKAYITDYNIIKDAFPGQTFTYKENDVTVEFSDSELISKGIKKNAQGYYEEKYVGSVPRFYEVIDTYTTQVGDPNEGHGVHHIYRTWQDELSQTSSKTEMYNVNDLIDFNAKYNYENSKDQTNTNYDNEKEIYTKLLNENKESYNIYTDLANDDLLTRIDMINSNKSIFKSYMKEASNVSDVYGYTRDYIKKSLNKVKELFVDTVNDKGKIPYVYGYSFGLLNLVKNSTSYGMAGGVSGILAWPVPDLMEVSYIYGNSAAYLDQFHKGIDISTKTSKEVIAVASGTVIKNEFDADGYGNYIIIDHGNGLATLYAHLIEKSTVQLNATVKKGDPIGMTGTTGNSTGIHLHYEVRKDSDNNKKFDYNETVDPVEYYNVEPNTKKGWTVEYEELLLDSTHRDNLTIEGAYIVTGPKVSGGSPEFIEMMHTWEGGNNAQMVNGVECYIIHNDGYGHNTVGHGIDIFRSGFLQRFIDNGYPTELGGAVPKEFVDELEAIEMEQARQGILSRTAGIQLEEHQIESLISRAYNCGISGATKERNGLNFVEAYNKYWVGNETTEIDYNHPFYVNYMSVPNTSSGKYSLGLDRRRRAEWIYFVTGTPANNGDVRIGI